MHFNDQLIDTLNARIFKCMRPEFSFRSVQIFGSGKAKSSVNTVVPKSKEYYNIIREGIVDSYYFVGKFASHSPNSKLINIDEIKDLITCYTLIADKERMMLMSDSDDDLIDYPELDDDIDEEDSDGEIPSEEKVLAVLESKLFADVVKLRDKYTIRIGDGKYYVASDEVSVVFRDPSERPSWAVWFLNAVPLTEIPNRGRLLMMPEDSRAEHYPKPLPDQPIICHASLWQMQKKTGVLLHVSWNHISASYRWVIDKPLDVASILFKATGHPAHLARNFGYRPNLAIPGDDWFGR